MYKENIQQIRQNRKLIAFLDVWCPSTGMFRVYGRVFCSISLLSVWMCMRMPLSLRSISGVPSSQALPGYLIIARHLCAFLLYFELWRERGRENNYCLLEVGSLRYLESREEILTKVSDAVVPDGRCGQCCMGADAGMRQVVRPSRCWQRGHSWCKRAHGPSESTLPLSWTTV